MKINKELWGVKPDQKPEAKVKKDVPVAQESPEVLRDRMESDVAYFQKKGDQGLEAAETRAASEGLIIDNSDKVVLNGLNQEAENERQEFITQIGETPEPENPEMMNQSQSSEEIRKEPAEEIQERPEASQIETKNMNQESPEKTIRAGQEKIHAMFAAQQQANPDYSLLWNMLMKQENGNYVWRQSGEIDIKLVENLLAKINQEEALRKRIDETIERFGTFLEISDADSPIVRKNLEYLSRLPEGLVELTKAKGLKVRLGNADVIGLSNDESFKKSGPRGWDKEKNDWQGVPGAYNRLEGTVYAGSGLHGCINLLYHEFGHGVGDKLGLDNAPETADAHKRFFDKLQPYLQQGGPEGLAGRQEFVAETFAQFLLMPKDVFVTIYDEDWYRFLEKNMNQEVIL